MPISVTCQRCGNAVGPDATQGLCPACLLEQGMRDSAAETVGVTSAAHGEVELAELSRIFPQLEILELLGRGGMGVVYKARQRGLDRLVALKLLPAGIDRDSGFRDRFVREARALARLGHPNIVAVYDFGQVEGRFYFLMEYVDGANLRRMLQAGHLSPQQAVTIVPQLCDALQYAHEEGIVHRDIKPENILIDRKGRVKIADFGLAKLLGNSLPQDPYTLTGPRQVLGTPHYMAPEQLERPGTVDHRADIYSMGVVFYEMLTGELPLGRFPPPSRKVQVDVRLDEVVLRTLEKEPEQRYQKAGEVKTQLASLGDQPGTWNAAIATPPPAAAPPSPRINGARPAFSRLAIAGFVVALVPVAVIMCVWAIVAAAGPGDVDEPFVILGAVIVDALPLLCGIVSCALGIAAIRDIRRSAGRLRGLGLALFDALAYPLLMLDVGIILLLIYLLDATPGMEPRVAIVVALLALGLDFFIARRLWRWVARPASPVGRPPLPPLQYALPPRTRMWGCLLPACIALGLMGLLFVGLAVPYIQMRRSSMRAAEVASVQGFIYADINTNSGAATADDGMYRFHFRSPLDCKTTVWAELWRNGKLVHEPGFDSSFWVIPPAKQPFDGVITFELASTDKSAPPVPGDVQTGWRVTGTSGSYLDDRIIPDPFANLPLRDSTWGVSTQWGVPEGRSVELLALRGGKHELQGPPGGSTNSGSADIEVHVFARFDRMVTPSQNPRINFGQSPTTPREKAPGPSSAPSLPQSTVPLPPPSTESNEESGPPSIPVPARGR